MRLKTKNLYQINQLTRDSYHMKILYNLYLEREFYVSRVVLDRAKHILCENLYKIIQNKK